MLQKIVYRLTCLNIFQSKKRKLLVVVKIMTNFLANIFSEYRVQRGAPEGGGALGHARSPNCTLNIHHVHGLEKSPRMSYFPFIVNRCGLENPNFCLEKVLKKY